MYMNAVNIAGFIHREKDCGSQDYISRVSRRGINGLCLCDGAGAYLHTEIGARRLSARLARFMSDQFYNLMVKDAGCIAEIVVNEIKKCMADLQEQYGCYVPHAYASTAICCAMKAATGEYIAVQLGDGFIGEIKSGTVRRLIVPRVYRSGDDARATMLSTASPGAMLRDIQVVKGVAEGVLMTSDGAEGLLYDRYGGASVLSEMLVKGVQHVGPGLAESLMERTARAFKSFDDVSIGLMTAGEYPRPEKLGFVYGNVLPHRQAMKEKRVIKKFAAYAENRDLGLCPEIAARRCGWGSRSTGKRQYCRENLHVY